MKKTKVPVMKRMTAKEREAFYAEVRRLSEEMQPLVEELLATEGLTAEDHFTIIR